ncbi:MULTISPECIES: hypothetical protein [unclassified Methanoregula]|uniref:hypothetical protein n=1 Tax=unclassified Methanoregula TaxID=2649730 RepID=UPI00342AE7C0
MVRYDGGGNDRGLGLALQSDGKILATGFTTNGSRQRDVLVLRYDSSGNPDRAFDRGGWSRTVRRAQQRISALP